MYKIFTIEIVILLQILVEIIAGNKTENIEKLEREKNDLFKQINEAIDESVKVLKNSNDTEANMGINYMETLKEQIKEINNTNADLNTQVSNDTRRKAKLSLEDIVKNLKYDSKDKKMNQKRLDNKVEIQKKVDEWILQRQLEQQKIKEYRQKKKMNFKFEKCPRHGVGSKKSKVARRSNKDKKRRNKQPSKYPCCRKCCKKSYMGCL